MWISNILTNLTVGLKYKFEVVIYSQSYLLIAPAFKEN